MSAARQILRDFTEALTCRQGWTDALLLCLVILLGTALPGCSFQDESSDWDQSTALKELQAAEAASARQEAAAAALCREARGPNSEHRWTPEGHLVCTTRRGLVAVQL